MIDILNIKDEPIFDDCIVDLDSYVQPVRQHNVRVATK